MKYSDLVDSVYFERFEIDLRAHVLRCDGRRITLQEQPFQVLLALIETPGEVVTRDTLRRRLWGDDTFVDFNQSMNSAVRRLRHALGDDPEYPVFIETVPRVGYFFVAKVTVSAAKDSEQSQKTPADERTDGPRGVPSWLSAMRWRDPVVAVWCLVLLCLVLLASSTLLLRENHWTRQTKLGAAQQHSGVTGIKPPAAVAVLPLRNLTGRIKDQYVVDGITDAVTTKLAERPGLRVMSNFPPTQVKVTGQTPEELARQVNVDSVVEGGVRRQGNRVWITAQLVDTSHGTYIWANTYTEDTNDLANAEISVADEVAREVDNHLAKKDDSRGNDK